MFDNFIARMYGPDFLIFYFLWIVGIFCLVSFLVNKRLRHVYFQPMLLSSQVNPYEIATLRGVDGLLSAIVFRLLHLEFLLPVKDQQGFIVKNLQKSEDSKQVLSPLERDVLRRFQEASTIEAARNLVLPAFAHNLELLYRDNLVVSQTRVHLMRVLIWGGFFAIIGMGLYKLTAALLTDHKNVLFLSVMILLSGLIYYYTLFKFGKNLILGGRLLLTNKGAGLIEHLMDTLHSLQRNKKALKRTLKNKDEKTLLLLFALFGLSSISDAQVQGFASIFPKEMLGPYAFTLMPLMSTSNNFVSNEGSGYTDRDSRSDNGCGSGCGSGCSGGGCGGCS